MEGIRNFATDKSGMNTDGNRRPGVTAPTSKRKRLQQRREQAAEIFDDVADDAETFAAFFLWLAA